MNYENPINCIIILFSLAHGYVKKGEMMAVMGPSSAGKSTLFNALTFKSTKGLKVLISKIL